ncbi:23S rRNA pseudouridine2605 synthase [Jannaschia faecimaris]|uniref:Pseudouridine synthase n=1 Tax=Jannaschia faecimaris TaxID=1244108 RepID=A0A1H3N5N3_9RHOB|nr:pseudouridine synthase [Jannaschia faecimaris]SDY84257.1 23S rRNA pseudouridine2605 synthase [Jannaschia faecimaris]
MTENTDRAGDRIAKVIARAGLASRRDAEKMVADLRVKVNGKTVSNVAHNVMDGDKVTVDGTPLPKADGARLWLYHKPAGLVTTEKDEKDRETVFETLPEELGRVLSVGRLDLNSEGLLLLTNDGDLKRQLELPSTGWLRRYRVRVNGKPDDAAIKKLADGITVEGEDGPETFAPMQITFDRQQGANAWLTVGLREGRNREIRRAFAAVDMYVNRLIRTSYGPFQLGNLPVGEVEEIKPRIVKEQLGGTWDGELAESRKEIPVDEKKDARAGRDGAGDAKGRKPRSAGDRLIDQGRGKDRRSDDAPRGKPRSGSPAEARVARAAKGDRPWTGKPPVTRNDGDGSRPPRGARPDRDDKRGPRPARDGDAPRKFGAKPTRDGDAPRKFGAKPTRDGEAPRKFGAKPPRKDWDGNPDRPSREGDRAPWAKGDRDAGSRDDKPRGNRPDRGGKPGGPKRFDDKPKETKSERTARLRADSSISLRKGGQRGRGIAKPKKAPSTKRMKKPEGGGED